MNSIKFSSSTHYLFGMYIFFALAIPILSYFLYSIINIPGILTLSFFWLINIISIISHLKASRLYCEITNQEVKISDGNSIVKFNIEAIQGINTQLLISKRMGVYEVFPYLVFMIKEDSKDKLNLLSNSREYGFIQKMDSLTAYMGEEKGDINIRMNTLKEKDLLKLKDIFNKPLQPLKPLVKTKDKEEYDKVVEKFIQK